MILQFRYFTPLNVDNISIPNLCVCFTFFSRFHFTFLYSFSLTMFQTYNVLYE
jgi:hypothetical protein